MKKEKLLNRLLSEPTDFTWTELVSLLSHYNYTEIKSGKTGGSRRKFVNPEKHIISLHKPHPGSILKRYQIKDVIAALRTTGILKSD